MPEYKVYWGDTHLNLHPHDEPRFEEAFEEARRHLDLLPIAYYPMVFDTLPSGFRVESWHNRPRYLRQWELINDLCRKYNAPGEFVTFPGYEWHGDRTRWGDHNVYYFAEGQPLDDSEHIDDLYDALEARRGLAIPHHMGYMTAQRAKDWDHFRPELSPYAEVYSGHGSSEEPVNRFPQTNRSMGPWASGSSYLDALARGYRVGAMASGDNHNVFAGVYGHGLMGVWAEELTREGLWEAFLARRVYGVTGDRIVARYTINGAPMGADVANEGAVTATLDVECPQALDRVDWLRNGRVISTYVHEQEAAPDAGETELCRLRIEPGWGPRDNYGFYNYVKEWSGLVSLSKGRLSIVQGCWTEGGNRLEQVDERRIAFDTITRSTHRAPSQAFIVEVEAPTEARLTIDAAPFDVSFSVQDALQRTQLWADLEGCKRLVKERFALTPEEVENPDVYYQNALKLRVVQAVPDSAYRVRMELVDPEPPTGENWYYVRLSQRDGQAAWLSPIWVEQS